MFVWSTGKGYPGCYSKIVTLQDSARAAIDPNVSCCHSDMYKTVVWCHERTGSVCVFPSRLHSFHSVSEIAVTFGLLNRAPTEDAHDCNLVVLLSLCLCSPFITTSASALSLACCLPTLPAPHPPTPSVLFSASIFTASVFFISQHLPWLFLPLLLSQYQRA